MNLQASPSVKGGQPVTGTSPTRGDRGNTLRHRIIRLGFVLLVAVPTLLTAVYLWLIAADAYHSEAAFSVRSEEFSNPLEALGAFTQVGSSSASDSQILYDYIRSQTLVEKIDAELDLREMFHRHPHDLVFSLGRDASREDLVRYWGRMVKVAVDSSTGVLSLQARGFSPEDAQALADAILAESARVVDELSRIARQDAIGFAREDLTEAEARLRDIRRRVLVFRVENDIIDPKAVAESQMGVIGSLQAQLATALVERETILGFADPSDQRVQQIDRRIGAIRGQIDQERARFSASAAAGSKSLVDVIGDYEELLVDLEFAQNAYTAAMAAEEQARAEARRTNRYLAVHIPPTLAQDSLYPQRFLLMLLVFVCCLAAYATMVLIYYNVRDRS